jgi:hypothetical protein
MAEDEGGIAGGGGILAGIAAGDGIMVGMAGGGIMAGTAAKSRSRPFGRAQITTLSTSSRHISSRRRS